MKKNLCSSCKFYTDKGCAVNPVLWDAYQQIKHLTPEAKIKLLPLLNECLDWQPEEKVTLTITLLAREWDDISTVPTINLSKLKVLIEAVRLALGKDPNDPFDDIPF